MVDILFVLKIWKISIFYDNFANNYTIFLLFCVKYLHFQHIYRNLSAYFFTFMWKKYAFHRIFLNNCKFFHIYVKNVCILSYFTNIPASFSLIVIFLLFCNIVSQKFCQRCCPFSVWNVNGLVCLVWPNRSHGVMQQMVNNNGKFIGYS